ncbi:hypothetical protein OJNDCHOG_01250 [Klebsiella phage 150040]|nr:hypothetical protein OJNDCHOG_01250 [Klebsiella phage 150040]UZO33420.1 hypothetical protein KEKKGBKC_00151 [Klebsiella phage pR7_1]
MKLPKNTTLLTREKLHSVDWCPLDIMIFDIESRVINAKYQACSIFSVEFEKIRGYDEKYKEKLKVMIEALGYIVTVEDNKMWIAI